MAILSIIFKAQDQVSRSMMNMDRQGNALEKSFGKLAKTMGAVFAGVQVANFAKDSTRAFMDFENGMNEVFTLLPDISGKAMQDMTEQVKQFSKDAGVIPEKTVPALYQALSAGVPKDNVFSFLETANKAAVGGVTSLETAVDGLSTVVNSYGADIIDTKKASDLMFTTVKLGKTNFEQLSQSLFNVLPSASAAGVKFEDVSAALATLTAQGVPTSVATTRVRAAIDELSKAGTKTDKVFREVAGKSFKEFIKEGGNLQGALQLLEKEAEKNNLGINDLFGSIEAGGAALALTGKATETFTNALDEMNKAAGATDNAFAKMEQGLKRKIDKLKARFEVFKLNVGGRLAGALNSVIDAGGRLINFFKSNFGKEIDRVTKRFTTLRDNAVDVGRDIVDGFKKVFSGGDFMNIFYNSFGSIEKFLKSVFGEKTGGVISDWVSKAILVIDKLQPTFSSIKSWVQGSIPTVKAIFQDVFDTVDTVVNDAYDIFNYTLLPAIDGIRAKVDEHMPTVRQVIKETFDKVTDVVEFASGKIKDFTNWITDNWPTIGPIVEGVGAAFAGWKVGTIVYDATKAVILFGIELVKLPGKLVAATVAQWNLVAAKVADKVETLAIIGLYAKDFLVALWGTVSAIGAQTAAWIVNGLQIAAQTAGLAALKVAQVVSAGVTWALTAAQWALNAAFIASPIGWIVLAIGALIGIGVLLWKNWDTVKAKAFELWEGIKTAFAPIGDFFKGVFEKAWQGIKGFINWIIGGINKLIKGINKFQLKIPDWLPGGGGTLGFNIPEIPMLAKGTISSPDTFIAGEEGPELITGARGSTVFPQSETAKIINSMDTQSRPFQVEVPRSSGLYDDSNKKQTTERVSTTNSSFIDQEKTVNININGSGSIKVDSSDSKESILSVMIEYMKPILMEILQQEVFEEGDLSYEF